MNTKAKKVLRWLVGILLVVLLLIVVAVLSIDPVVKKMAEKRIQQETGMTAEIGKLHIGFYDQSLTVKNFKLLNPPEFGGGTFLELPELHVEYDLEAARSNIVHLRVVKLDLAQLQIVENKDGKRNVDVFMKGDPKKTKRAPSSTPSTNAPPKAPQLPFEFGGIDKLDVTLGKTVYSSQKYPERSFDRNLGIKNEVFKDIKNEQDLQTVGIVLSLKAGLATVLQNGLF